MRKLTMIGAVTGALILTTITLASTAHAGATDATWTANGDSAITGQHSVLLKGTNTSVETTNLGVTVEANTPVSFDVELHDGATCTAGAPRVFVVVDGTLTNSWDQLLPAGKQCGDTITFHIPNAGTITAAGLVYDNNGTGSVTIRNLTVADTKIAFKSAPPTDNPTTKPTGNPTTTPTSSPATTPTSGPTTDPTTNPQPTPSATGTGGGLPVTGANTPTLIGLGVLLVVGGAAAVFAIRRRRTTFQA